MEIASSREGRRGIIMEWMGGRRKEGRKKRKTGRKNNGRFTLFFLLQQ